MKRKNFHLFYEVLLNKQSQRKALDMSLKFSFIDQILSCDKIDTVEIKYNFIYS